MVEAAALYLATQKMIYPISDIYESALSKHADPYVDPAYCERYIYMHQKQDISSPDTPPKNKN